MKDKHDYYLTAPNGKTSAPQTQHKKAAVFKKLQAALYDVLDKNCNTKLKKSKFKMLGHCLEKGKMDRPQSNKGVESSAKVGEFSGELDTGETNSDCGIRKTESGAESSDNFALRDQTFFARFSFMESNYGNAGTDPPHAQKGGEGKESFQSISVLISNTQKGNTKCFEPNGKGMGYGSDMVKETERGNACYKTEEDQDAKTMTSRQSSGITVDHVTQPNSIDCISVSGKGFLQSKEIIPAFTKDTFSKIFVSRMTASTLSDKKDHEGGTCQGRCASESFSGSNFKSDLKTITPKKTEIKMPIKEGMGLSLNTLTEKINEDQMALEEDESNSLSSNKNTDGSWFLLQNDGILNDDAPTCVTHEETSGELAYGDSLSEYGVEILLVEGDSAGQAFPGDDAAFMDSEIGKATMPVEPKEDCFFNNEKENMGPPPENMDPQPTEETSSMGEEESLQLRQSRGVKMVFYELSGPRVRLLGTPSVNCKISRLGKCTELEDFSNAEKSEVSSSRLSSKSKKKEDSRAKQKTRRRPKKTPKPPNSWLSQEQSRIKVVDALKETFQKILKDSPDLDVEKNKASKVATEVEKEIFGHFNHVNRLYKNKYRSILFNLKSTNNQLFHKLMLGKITPKRLVQMSSLEMASKELMKWRAKANKHVLQMIEKEEQEVPRRCTEKFTHKGIIEICREADMDLVSEEIIESLLLKEGNAYDEAPSSVVSSQRGELAADSERGFEPSTYNCTFKQKANTSKVLRENITYSEECWRPEDEDRPAFSSLPRRKRQAAKQSSRSVIWNGLIQMFSVKQFVAKAYPVSGFGCHLCQALPAILQSKGSILPKDVWTYVDSIWPTNRKGMGLIRFHPSLSKDVSPYNTLYTYLNNRQRYGLVESSQMEIFLVPLPAYQLVPSQLHSVGGPGLDRCHPSLLLGLVLPKRTCLDTLKTSHDFLPKAKRKKVTSKDGTETSCFIGPSHIQVDIGQEQTPRQLFTESLSSEEGLASLPKQEGLTVDTLLDLIEQLKSQILHRVPSSLCHQEARDEVNQPSVDDTLRSTTNSASTGELSGNLTLEILGAQPCQSGEERQFCIDPHPSDFCSTLGILLPSEMLCPDQQGAPAPAAQGINTFEALLLPNVLCAEAVVPFEECQLQPSPQISCTNIIGEHNTSVQETLSLLQHVTQLQSHAQNQGAQPLSFLTQEITSTLAQISAGIELFPVQQDDGSTCGM